MNPKVKVCMISSLHGLYDDRIYWKEALSLKKHGYDVYHIGIGNKDKEFISDHGIKLIQVGKQKYFENPYTDKLYRILTFKKNIYKKILKTAAELKADVYHFHDSQINKIGKQLKSLAHKPKVIYDVHEPYPQTIRYSFANNLFLRIIHWIYSIFIYNRFPHNLLDGYRRCSSHLRENIFQTPNVSQVIGGSDNQHGQISLFHF